MEKIAAALDPAKFSPNSEVSFSVRHFENETVFYQGFSPKWDFTWQPVKPGFYNVIASIRSGDSLSQAYFPLKYLAPDCPGKLDSQDSLLDFANSIIKARKRNNPEAFRVISHNQQFDFLFFPSSLDRLFVLCPSGIIRGQFPVPYFYRWAWANQGIFPGNVLVVSDPTFNLDKNLEVGWFVGDKDNDATENFSKLLKIICKALNLPFRELTFWGSSAGGFIAMQMSKYFPGSTAVAINAQTDVHKYNGHQLLYAKGFPGMSAEEINHQFGARLRLAENLDLLAKNHIFMTQNKLDQHHYEQHFKPFANLLNMPGFDPCAEKIWHERNSPYTIWVYSHPAGHMAETQEMAHLILRKLEVQKRTENLSG